MSMRNVAGIALNLLFSAGDAPGSGPGPFESFFGLPGMPPGLKKFGKLMDDPNYKPDEGDLFDVLSDVPPFKTGPFEETFREGLKAMDSKNNTGTTGRDKLNDIHKNSREGNPDA